MRQGRIKTMQEFAEVSGLSRPTISKYFFDPSSVRSTTRARIEEALKRYDYRPNIYAMNQNRRLTRAVGIVVPFLADPFFAEIARNIERLAIEAGFRPIVFSSHGETVLEIANLDSIRALKPAGALLAPLGKGSDKGALEEFCDQCRLALREAQAGNSVRPAATKLQKDARDLSSELANIQSERLLARGIGADTRQLQAYVESLAVYISLLATILKNLATEDLPEANRMLLNELSADLDASFGTALDQHVAPVDVKDLTERWFEATKLDGSIHPRDAMWLIEVLVYGRKCLEVIGDVRSLLADHVTERTRRRA